MRLRLNLMPGFTLATSLTDLAAMAVRILTWEPRWPTTPPAWAGDQTPNAPFPQAIGTEAPMAQELNCPLTFAGAHRREVRLGSPPGDMPCNGPVSHRLLYDGAGPNARLIGVEYLVSDEVYRQMPAEEKLYWHDHKHEVGDGLLSNPRQSRSQEKATLHEVRTRWGKVYHTWASGSEYPRGPSRLYWSETGELPFVLPAGAEAQLSIR
jgi:hypothetical protein